MAPKAAHRVSSRTELAPASGLAAGPSGPHLVCSPRGRQSLAQGGATVLHDDPGPVCAFGSEAERVVPERTVMAACRSAEAMRLSIRSPGRGKAASAAPGRERQRSAVLEGAGTSSELGRDPKAGTEQSLPEALGGRTHSWNPQTTAADMAHWQAATMAVTDLTLASKTQAGLQGFLGKPTLTGASAPSRNCSVQK